ASMEESPSPFSASRLGTGIKRESHLTACKGSCTVFYLSLWCLPARALVQDGRGGHCDLGREEMGETELRLVEQGYYEVKFAFEGLADENVWKRPAEGLLSVGELAGHIAYWEAVRLAGEGEDLANCKVSSPLVDNRFRYYPNTIA